MLLKVGSLDMERIEMSLNQLCRNTGKVCMGLSPTSGQKLTLTRERTSLYSDQMQRQAFMDFLGVANSGVPIILSEGLQELKLQQLLEEHAGDVDANMLLADIRLRVHELICFCLLALGPICF
jgi:hypothetical protein